MALSIDRASSLSMNYSLSKRNKKPSYKFSQCTPGRPLGHGSFGQVLSAKVFNPLNGTHHDIAIKRALLKHSSTLQKEAKVLSAFSDCPEIIDFYGYDITTEEKDVYYNLFLEYAPAGDLKDLLGLNEFLDGLSDTDVRAYTRTILEALQCLHDKSYIHCDVKPKNILVFPSGTDSGYRVKLADFGLVQEPNEPLPGDKHGTPQYICPESRYKEETIGPAWDIWSLGCTVVVIATGKSGALGRAMAVSKMPKEGADFVSKCLEEDPKKRWSVKMLLNHPYISQPPMPHFLLPHHILAAADNNSNCNGSFVSVSDCVCPLKNASGTT